MRKFSIALTAALAAGLLAGCTATDAPTPEPTVSASASPTATATPTPSPAAIPKPVAAKVPSDLELSQLPFTGTFEVYGAVAPADPGTPFTGKVASIPAKRDFAIAYVKPGGKAFALVGSHELSDRTAMPIIKETPGWVQVLIPGRRHLPSSGKPVNGASAWLTTDSVSVKEQTTEVVAELSKKTVTVTEAGEVVASFPIIMDGKDLTPDTRGFAVSSYWTEAQKRCSTEKLLALSTQSEKYDSFVDGAAIMGIHGWAPECRAVSAQTQRTSGCINLADADMAELLMVKPGTPVTVKS